MFINNYVRWMNMLSLCLIRTALRFMWHNPKSMQMQEVFCCSKFHKYHCHIISQAAIAIAISIAILFSLLRAWSMIKKRHKAQWVIRITSGSSANSASVLLTVCMHWREFRYDVDRRSTTALWACPCCYCHNTRILVVMRMFLLLIWVEFESNASMRVERCHIASSRIVQCGSNNPTRAPAAVH